jgi:hypothetical protein
MTTRIGAPQVGQRAARGGGGGARRRLVLAGVRLHDQSADGIERDGTAGMEQAEMADLHKAIGQDMLEEAADKLDGVEMSRTGAGTTHFPVGEGDGAVGEAHDTAVGNSDPEDIRGEVSEGGVAMVLGLTVDVPGDGPDLWVDMLQEAGVVHVFFEDGAVDR